MTMNEFQKAGLLTENSENGEQHELGRNLILASRAGETATVLNLMKIGAPFATDWWGLTCLHHAALGGHLETCELLVKSGIARDTKSKVEKTPLQLACQEGHADVAMFLIAHGADIHASDMILMTPLHWAVEMQHEETVLVLLQNGADPSRVNKFEKTCYAIAADKGYDKILSLLRAGPHNGNYTITELLEPKMSDMIKKRINSPMAQQVKTFVHRSFDLPKTKIFPKKSSSKRLQGQEIMRQLLEEHGIETLEGEDVNLVATAVDSGQTVILTEAGKQALTLTGTMSKRKSPTANEIVKYKATPSHYPKIMRRPPARTNNETIMAAVAEVTEKFFQAKREAKQYKMLYNKKQREIKEYQSKLQYFALHSLGKVNETNVELMESLETDNDSDALFNEESRDALEEELEEVT